MTLTPQQLETTGDDLDQCIKHAVLQERELWERRIEDAALERSVLANKNERLMEILGGIFALLPPNPAEVNGNTFIFNDPNANQTLRELKSRILAINEAVRAIRNSQDNARYSAFAFNLNKQEPV